MPAFLATTHWEGTPSMESLACFTSLYSCWPADRGRGGGGRGVEEAAPHRARQLRLAAQLLVCEG